MFNLLLVVIYLAFISLGLPDSLLGSAWPTIYPQFNVPVSFAGIISFIISLGTIVSSLNSDRLTRKLGTGKVTALSVALTAIALFGFSISGSFLSLCLWAIPYGLGAGSVDAALNNYVALHYKSKHMSWLHCMWGIGASTGPYIMGYVMTSGGTWNGGYRVISIIQLVLTAIILFSLPLWKKHPAQDSTNGSTASVSKAEQEPQAKALTIKEVFAIKGVPQILLCFFCYCALENTTGLWASSYLTIYKGVSAEQAATFASMFYIGITIGRGISGFITFKLNDEQMIRLGQVFVGVGAITILLPFSATVSLVGFILVGLGCAPIYPSIIHSTPAHFGAENSQAIIGIQMAFAYIGSCVMPPVFGLIAEHLTVALLPYYQLVVLVLMIIMHESLTKKLYGKR
jgi:fucose permease